MTVIGTALFLFGGHSGNRHLTDLSVFDTSKLHWTTPAVDGSPPPGLRGHTATLIGRKILLFGGYDGKGRTNEMYILDVNEKRWIRPAWAARYQETPPGRQRHTSSLIGKRLYVFGGFDGSKWLSDLHVLDMGRMEENDMAGAGVQRVIANMSKMVNEEEFADVVFVVGGSRLYAHKCVLATQVEHFRNMFGSGMKESTAKEIEVPGWGAKAFSALLQWVYTGRTGQELGLNEMTELLGIADTYGLDELRATCEAHLVHDVDVETCCSLLKVADRHQASQLKSHCMTYLLQNFAAASKTEAFEELSAVPGVLLEVTRQAATGRAMPRLSTP